MTRPRTIDIHTHILTEEMIGLLAKEAPWIAPKLTPIDEEFAVLEVAGTPYRPFPRGGWELERRFKDMDAAEVDVQVLSATPQTYLYDQDPALTAATSALQNDQIAKLVKEHPDRFMGIATLPMQAPENAAAELGRAVRELGMHGAMIGSNIIGKNLDDPSLEPVWAAAEELGAFMMIHPANVAGADRLRSYYLAQPDRQSARHHDRGRLPGVRRRDGAASEAQVLLVHGGGFVPYQAGRWAHGWHVRPEPKINVKKSPEPWIDRFYYDTILHAKPQLEFLVASVGAAARAARQRLSLRHGHRRMCAPGRCALDRRFRKGGDPGTATR